MSPEENPDLLIAEYVLGVLSREERERVEAMIALDPRHQRALAQWQEQFAEWLGQLPASSPPLGTWSKIEQRLFAGASRSPSRASGWWNNLGLWRWTSAALAAGLLASVLTLQQPGSGTGPALLARLDQSDGNTLFAATINPDRRGVLFVNTGHAEWPGKSAEVWVIAADGKPRSLGVLPANASATLNVTPQLADLLASGAVLAVTLEPLNGSPSGLPTGPVVAQGKISSL
ncbi:anti-sigma factor [Pseudomonas sp. KU26590]|uniref:anti-sigma factor n=1 Tax=Pseudomonas sp. KU26590 TaxID=2991051 RepID=UPI00223E5B37|nr:anti-sigma factor [Pseudomonas sp. KU26590]UZJ62094.1 anti-sigma factor [Pseudomonas sp. KU26590]